VPYLLIRDERGAGGRAGGGEGRRSVAAFTLYFRASEMPDAKSRVPLNALIAIVISAVRLIKLIPAAVNAREREREREGGGGERGERETFVRRGAHRGIIRRACVTKTLSRPLNDLDKCRPRARGALKT